MATIGTVYYEPSLLGLSTTLGVSCAISVACLVAFEVIRKRPSMQYLFTPRTRLTHHPAPPLQNHLFSWLTGTWRLDESYFLHHVGLDAAMYIRFLRMAVQFLTLCVMVVGPTLLLLHWNAQTPPTTAMPEQHFRSNATLYRLSMSNVPAKANTVWVHVVLTWFISLGWLWLLFVNHFHRLLMLKHVERLPHQRSSTTVLLRHIPRHLRHQTTLHRYFSCTVGPVASASVLSKRALRPLRKALERRKMAVYYLERLILGTVQRNKAGDWTSHLHPRDCANVLRLLDQIASLDKQIGNLRSDNAVGQQEAPTGTAFITFRSPISAQACTQMTFWKPGVCQARIAPHPNDLLWRGLIRHGRWDKLAGKLRQSMVSVAVWSLTIFWLFPVSFILGLTSIESLSHHFAFLVYFLDTSDAIRSFIQNVLPMLLVTLFMSLLPSILLVLTKQEDFTSYSKLEDCVLGRYYRFAIFNVLIVFLLGPSFLSTILNVLYEPARLTHLLATFLPQGANFFLNHILFNLSTHAMELIQLGSQLFGHMFLTLPCIADTPRRLAEYTRPWSFPFYYYYPNHILILVITLTYAVIQPLILVVALIYFGWALLCYKHQFAYCYIRRYESNGAHYRRVVGYTSDGLLIFQMTMVGLLYLKDTPAAATAILPLIIFTIWAKIRMAKQFGCQRPGPVHDDARTPLEDTLTRSEGWWLVVDDIWKFSYVRAWWVHGRYATQHLYSFREEVSEFPERLEAPDPPYSGCSHTSRMSSSTASGNGNGNGCGSASSSSTRSTNSSGGGDQTLPISPENDQAHLISPNVVHLSFSDATLDLCSSDKNTGRVPLRSADRYTYPPLVIPLEQFLWIPRDPRARHWALQECFQLSFQTLRTLCQTAEQSNGLSTKETQVENYVP